MHIELIEEYPLCFVLVDEILELQASKHILASKHVAQTKTILLIISLRLVCWKPTRLRSWMMPRPRVRHEIKASPLGRMVRLGEVARLVHFLCSSASEGILGQTIMIDGGKSISAFCPV